MADVEIRLRIDPKTGKKTVTVSYDSDADALPMEHEEEHRRVVEALLHKGIIDASEAGDVVVERAEEAAAEPSERSEETAEQRQSVEQDQ